VKISDLNIKSDFPETISSLTDSLKQLGVSEGSTLLVHSSLRTLGWVCGGAVAVIQALEGVLGERGTLVMPTHSSDLSDPSVWRNPPVPKAWWEIIRKEMPPFQPDLTPTWRMGAIAETFRKQEATIRSDHPQVSFAARGANAKFITEKHTLNFALGEGSPLARIYDLDGSVLLLGVTHSSNTSIHLAEYRANYPWKHAERQYAPMLVDGVRKWVEMEDINGTNFDFMMIGDEFDKHYAIASSKIGNAQVRLFKQRRLVDFAVRWMEENRQNPPNP
jgi:aminoglycoside 3-N-acetyltransferase